MDPTERVNSNDTEAQEAVSSPSGESRVLVEGARSIPSLPGEPQGVSWWGILDAHITAYLNTHHTWSISLCIIRWRLYIIDIDAETFMKDKS